MTIKCVAVNAADIAVDDTTGAVSFIDGATGDPYNLTDAVGGNAYANPDEGATSGIILRACGVVFASVAANGCWLKIGSGEYHIRPNSWREIAPAGGIPAATVIQAKNLTAGSNFADLKIEVR